MIFLFFFNCNTVISQNNRLDKIPKEKLVVRKIY